MSDDPYGEPVLYDLEYAGHVEDVAWYVGHAQRAPGPVVELGCGTGRLTIPLARAGVRVVGIDRAAPMVAELRRKLGREPPEVQDRVQLEVGDYTAFDPALEVATVLWPFNALHHLAGPDDVRAMLRRIRGWLEPGGRLLLDTYLPDLELYDRDPEQRYEPRQFVDPRTGEVLESWEQGWWDGDTHVHHVLYVYEHPDGRQERSHLRLRMYELDELHALLAAEGWRLLRESQDFEGTPLGERPLKWVAVAQPTRRAATTAGSRDRSRPLRP